ncbi:MAG: radical SAM protein [Acidobacteria bacterium]|nr:radical SAM protein [Acidobacteriota bacterium]
MFWSMRDLNRPSAPVDGRFLLDPHEPVCLALHRSGELAERVEVALRELEDCCACPRNCHVNRLQGEARVCHTGRYARVASAFPHFGEEDCLRGWNGSGTIFFSLCNLRCVFCQNWDISQAAVGPECPPGQIASLMLTLERKGCHNINFVTPEHVVPQVIEAVAMAIPKGLRLPIVYNTSAYDSLRSLRLLEGIVDIYMPDFKFWSYESARRYAKAKDYPERVREAILEMHRQVGTLRFGPDGLARRGLLVRHLVMPGQTEEVARICEWLAREVSPDTYVNLMDQYRPEFQVGARGKEGGPQYAEINRSPTSEEIDLAHAAARAAGLWRFDERWFQAA